MIGLFERQVVKCRTINEFNRLRIALENRITPLELTGLSNAAARGPFASASKDWIDKLGRQIQRSGKNEPERFYRRRLKPNLYLYADGTSTFEKTLIIAFTGGAHRLMMPIATFLQHIDAASVDVLLLLRHGDSVYSNGIRGLANSFAGLIDVLEAFLRTSQYKRVVTFGTSSGGVPAILTALYLGLDKGISVGGSSLEQMRWIHIKDEEPFKRAMERWDGKPHLLSVFSAEHEMDKKSAHEMQKILPISLVPLLGETKHGAIHGYMPSGKLEALLHSLFAPSSDHRTGMGSGSSE